MDTLQKVIGARAKIRRNLQQKSSALSLYRRNAAEDTVEQVLLEEAVKEVALIDQLQNDLKACNKLVDTLVTVVFNEVTGYLYRDMGLSPAMGFGSGKMFDSDLSNASGMRTALTNVGGRFLSTGANLAFISFKPTVDAAKAMQACVDAVFKDPQYDTLAKDPAFLELIEDMPESSGEARIFTIIKNRRKTLKEEYLEGATPELKEAFNNLKTAGKVYGAAYLVMKGSNAYHGYKRNDDNIGYGALWLIFGGFVGVGQSIAQGYAKNIN
jgi:hypothetical protein